MKRGLHLLNAFEGCRLTAYKCSCMCMDHRVWSYSGVHSGQAITQAQADALLRQDLEKLSGMSTVLHMCRSLRNLMRISSRHWLALLLIADRATSRDYARAEIQYRSRRQCHSIVKRQEESCRDWCSVERQRWRCLMRQLLLHLQISRQSKRRRCSMFSRTISLDRLTSYMWTICASDQHRVHRERSLERSGTARYATRQRPEIVRGRSG